jgi:hypothetical protein
MNHVVTTTKLTMLPVETQFNTQMFKTRVIAVRVGYDRVPNVLLDSVFVDYFADAVGRSVSAVTTFDLW